MPDYDFVYNHFYECPNLPQNRIQYHFHPLLTMKPQYCPPAPTLDNAPTLSSPSLYLQYPLPHFFSLKMTLFLLLIHQSNRLCLSINFYNIDLPLADCKNPYIRGEQKMHSSYNLPNHYMLLRLYFLCTKYIL